MLPREIAVADHLTVLLAVEAWQEAGLRLVLGRMGALSLERVVEDDTRTAFASETWLGPSRRWASVTPVALDENPGDLSAYDPEVAGRAVDRAEDIVTRGCERIGLPRPRWVRVTQRSAFEGVPAAAGFMPFPRRPGALRRVCVHVEMRFDELIRGPVLLGAGRYLGLGLCAPRPESS